MGMPALPQALQLQQLPQGKPYAPACSALLSLWAHRLMHRSVTLGKGLMSKGGIGFIAMGGLPRLS